MVIKNNNNDIQLNVSVFFLLSTLETEELEEIFGDEAETGKSSRFWFVVLSYMYLKTQCKRTKMLTLADFHISLFLNLKFQELEENFEDQAETGESLRFWFKLFKVILRLSAID